MFITSRYAGYTRDGQQSAAGLFLILFSQGMNGASSEIRAAVRDVRMTQMGHWMMASTRIGPAKITLSGSYGSDGLTCDADPNTGIKWDRLIPIPEELRAQWAKGDGWNSAPGQRPISRHSGKPDGKQTDERTEEPMSYTQERERFIARMSQHGLPFDVILGVLRDASTIARLAAAQCNGDYPCDNGERKTKPCTRCESGYAPSSLTRAGICPDCRAQDRLIAKLNETARQSKQPAIGVMFGGDPRGYTTKLYPKGATMPCDANGHKDDGIGVPTRD